MVLCGNQFSFRLFLLHLYRKNKILNILLLYLKDTNKQWLERKLLYRVLNGELVNEDHKGVHVIFLFSWSAFEAINKKGGIVYLQRAIRNKHTRSCFWFWGYKDQNVENVMYIITIYFLNHFFHSYITNNIKIYFSYSPRVN